MTASAHTLASFRLDAREKALPLLDRLSEDVRSSDTADFEGAAAGGAGGGRTLFSRASPASRAAPPMSGGRCDLGGVRHCAGSCSGCRPVAGLTAKPLTATAAAGGEVSCGATDLGTDAAAV